MPEKRVVEVSYLRERHRPKPDYQCAEGERNLEFFDWPYRGIEINISKLKPKERTSFLVLPKKLESIKRKGGVERRLERYGLETPEYKKVFDEKDASLFVAKRKIANENYRFMDCSLDEAMDKLCESISSTKHILMEPKELKHSISTGGEIDDFLGKHEISKETREKILKSMSKTLKDLGKMQKEHLEDKLVEPEKFKKPKSTGWGHPEPV